MSIEYCNKENVKSLFKCMELSNFKLLEVFKINGEYIIGIYQGSLSEFDILIKYRQKQQTGKWSRI